MLRLVLVIGPLSVLSIRRMYPMRFLFGATIAYINYLDPRGIHLFLSFKQSYLYEQIYLPVFVVYLVQIVLYS